jgi:hypothetical protein
VSLVSERRLELPRGFPHMALNRFGPAVRHTLAVFLVLLPAEGVAIGVVGQHFEQRIVELVVASGAPEGAAAQEAIDIIVNAYREPARIAIITATNAGGRLVTLGQAEAAMDEAAACEAVGWYNEASTPTRRPGIGRPRPSYTPSECKERALSRARSSFLIPPLRSRRRSRIQAMPAGLTPG